MTWFNSRKDDGMVEKQTVGAELIGTLDSSLNEVELIQRTLTYRFCGTATNLVPCEFASVAAEEILGESLSDTCKVLALWLALSHFPAGVIKSGRKSEGRRKVYYKYFLPIMREGLKSAAKVTEALSSVSSAGNASAKLLIDNVWRKLHQALACMLSPIPDATNIQKISRVPEVLDVLGLSIAFVPMDAMGELCAVLSDGASNALQVEKANRNPRKGMSDGEIHRKRLKYRDDAMLVFKTCYAGICKTKSDDPALLAITDKTFTDTLAIINAVDDGVDDISVNTFLMVCQAFEENPGMDGLIISSFPLLCKLVQTDREEVRKAAAAALGSADLRQVISDARKRYENAEKRAKKAEKDLAARNIAIAELQKKNEILQQQVALSSGFRLS